MSIKFEESVEAEAVGSDNNRPAQSGNVRVIVGRTTAVRPAGASAMRAPQLIADVGEHASLRFLNFFTANIETSANGSKGRTLRVKAQP